MLLFALILFIFALLGMQFFGGQFLPPKWPLPPRPNFDSIGSSMLAVSVVATMEDWNSVWLNAHRAAGGMSALYFVALLVVGSFLLMNLIIATLIGSFDAADSDSPVQASPPGSMTPMCGTPTSFRRGSPSRSTSLTNSGEYSAEREDDTDLALGFLRRSNTLRLAAHNLIHTSVRCRAVSISFDTAVLFVILLSSSAMALDSCDFDDASSLAAVLAYVDLGATALFTFELCVKVVALGLYAAPTAYLRSGWNRLDALVVTTSLLSVAAGASPAFRALRVLRVLRPLRLLSMVPAMKLVTTLLLTALPRVLDVAAVSMLFLAIFAVLGVQLFGGRLSSCEGAPHLTTRQACADAGEEWRPPSFGSFDDVGAAALLLFEVATLEGWPDVLFACIDATRVGHAPERDANPANAFFLMLWVMVGNMCLVNLLVGVLVETFDQVRRQEEGVAIMSSSQKQW